MSGILYLVPTPIGNLGDISRRQIEVLSAVDFIAAEDTRVSLKLLNHLDIRKPLTSYHRHNTDTAGPAILSRLLDGESCALVTDAGTPAVSDPGEELVALCAANGVDVISVPGPCAAITALAASGLPTGRFTFEGFLPTNKKNRRARLEGLTAEERTMIFYEAPHKLRPTLDDLRETFGAARRISLCRELTKLHEEILRTTLDGAVERYRDAEPKGEFVLIVEGAAPVEPDAVSPEAALERVEQLRTEGLSQKNAVRQAAEELKLPKNKLYDLALGKNVEW